MKSEFFPLIKCVRGKTAALSDIPKVEKLHGSCVSLYGWGGVIVYSVFFYLELKKKKSCNILDIHNEYRRSLKESRTLTNITFT